MLDPHFKHGPPGASAENKKSLWEALEEDGVKIALSMLMYSSHEQNTLSVVNGMSQQQELEDNALSLTVNAANSLSMFGDAALSIPETGEMAAALQDDEPMCQLKVQHKILKHHMTRMHLEGQLSQFIDVLKQW